MGIPHPTGGYTYIAFKDGEPHYLLKGVRHREDGPAVVYTSGTKEWYIHGQLHREDGPAMESAGGSREWYINGLRHREDGPAMEWIHGPKRWYRHGQKHRTDGPAIINSSGSEEWLINGQRVPADQAKRSMAAFGSALWYDWDNGLARELVEGGVDPEHANETYAAGITEPEGLRRVLLEGVPLEWVLAWEGR